MCGIAGSFGIQSDSDWVNRQLQVLSRRGPDSSGSVNAGNICTLVACRLAMTDPNPRSNQPFKDSYSGNLIVFNGEIYNHEELKTSLVLQFPKEAFRTESDTEVLLRWVDKFGVDGIAALQGMFAFVYLDVERNKIVLARDSLGKKPLYIREVDANLIWSSSLNTFQVFEEVAFDEDALIQFLTLGYTLDPNTVLKNVRAILPGQVIECEFVKNGLRLNRQQVKYRRTHTNDGLREAMHSAVERRVEGHTDIAVSLSGGVDSTIVSIHLRDQDRSATAFSAFWPDSDKEKYNLDAIYASKIAQRLGMNHVQVQMPNTDQIESYLSKFLDAMQEPNANPTGLSLFALYEKIAEQGHRLVITGDGSDEIFAGYQRYQELQRMAFILKSNSKILRRRLMEYNGLIGRGLSKLSLSFINQDLPEAWLYWHGIYSRRELSELYSNPVDVERFESAVLERINDLYETTSFSNPISKMMARDHQIWLDMESNRKLDRISMYFSIEARSPFQDERVISIALREKEQILKSAGSKSLLWHLYPELENLGVRKDKEGFISPVGHWLRSNPKLVNESLAYLSNQKAFNRNTVLAYRDAPYLSNFRRIKQLWHLVVWAQWHQNARLRVVAKEN